MKEMIEIERKWILADDIDLNTIPGSQLHHVTQFYLEAPYTERIREDICNDKVSYTHTIKKPIQKGLGNLEEEEIIDFENFKILSWRINPLSRPIIKKRTIFYLKDLKYEVDQFVYPFPFKMLEVEIPTEDTPVPIPEFLGRLVEVTKEKLFSNHKISLYPENTLEAYRKIILAKDQF